MNLKGKFFDELSKEELHEILKARQAVFIVEQDKAYEDIDEIDYKGLHNFYEQDGDVKAYLRATMQDDNRV